MKKNPRKKESKVINPMPYLKPKSQEMAQKAGTNLGNQGYMTRYAGKPVRAGNVKSNDPSENTYDPTKIKKPNTFPSATKVQKPVMRK